MRTRIISAFLGTGKTYYHKKYPDTTLDVDISIFMECTNAFPSNFIEYIRSKIGKYEFIFVSTHKEVREILLDNCIFFYLIYPSPFDDNKKEFYLERYRERGDPESFIKYIDENWTKWTKQCWFTEYGCENIKMTWATLEKELGHIVAKEHGDVKEDEDEKSNSIKR